MNEVVSVYTPGVIGCIEQFTLAAEDLRQFVIYKHMVKYLREKGQDDPVLEEAAAIILDLYDRLGATVAVLAVQEDD